MRRIPVRIDFRTVARAAVPALAVLALCACAGQAPAGRDAEAESLRERVARLEAEAVSDRARLAADISAMREDMRALRQSLDEAARNLAASSGQPRGQQDPGQAAPGQDGAARSGQQGKSPRQALRDSLRSMLEVSRQALERLNLELERQIEKQSQPTRPDRPGTPGKEPLPAAPNI